MQAKGPIVPQQQPKMVILGAGFIGVSFAAAFIDAGFNITLVEPDQARRSAVPGGMKSQHDAIIDAGLEQGSAGQIKVVADAGNVLTSADIVLECGPEDLGIKQKIFAGLIAATGPDTVLATASSAIPMSQIVTDVAQQARCLVAHPVNPPAVLRVIELVPAPKTSAEIMSRAAALFGQAGFEPVILGREIEGFILNRLQGAVLREAYRLVEDGIATVDGIDAIMRRGLGPRWALSGPFETAELNTPGGILAHAARLGPAYRRMGQERGETVDWNETLLAKVAAERRAICPEDELPARARWRTRAVARLVAARDKLIRAADD